MPNKLLFQTLQNSELPVWDKVQVILDLAEQKNNEVYPIILKLMEQPLRLSPPFTSYQSDLVSYTTIRPGC